MAISQKDDSKRSPLSPSKSKINKRIWEIKKNLVKQRLMGLGNGKKNTLELAEPLNGDKPIKCLPPKISVSTSAVERAKEIQANLPPQFPNFSKLMLKSHVSGGFWLGLPRQFCVANLPKYDETIVLVDENGKEYDTKYLADKNGLSGGWRGFSMIHNLCEEDVLVFQLIERHKFKLYIVRARSSTEVDGTMCLPNLDSEANSIHAVKIEDQPEETEIPSQKYLEPGCNDQDRNMAKSICNNEPTPNQPHGIRFSESIVSFNEVNSFKNFNIHVDGLILDSEMPAHLRKKYYDLCCSKNMFLHENLITGLNSKLAVGIISETINIADAIRAANRKTGLNHLENWDKTLKAFEDLGMVVGFLRARIHKLVNLCREFEAIFEFTTKERDKAKNKLWALETLIRELDEQIEALKVKNEELDFVFKEIANDPW